jgi:hypothetical protein
MSRERVHACEISDLRKIRRHDRGWAITKTLDDTFQEMVRARRRRLAR